MPIQLPEESVAHLLDLIEELPQTKITLDLARQAVELPQIGGSQNSWTFEIDPFRKQCLMRGLDDLGYLLDKEEQISAFEAAASF